MAEEESDLDSERFKQELESLFTRGNSDEPQSKYYCSRFCELVERHAGRWCVPLPQLQVLQTALCSFTRGTAFFPADCEHVGYALSSLALSYFELLLFFGKEEFLEDPLKGILDSFQECHSCLARHKNVYLLRVGQIIKDGGSWEHPVLQAILTESVQPCEKVEEYLNSEVPVFFEFRVRYLMACNRIQEAIVLAMRCLEHPVMCRHPYFHQAYLTCLWKASLYDRLHKEMAAIDGRDAVEIICNTESEQKDEMLLALCKEFLTQQLQNGDMYYLWDLIFIWSKLHLRANPSRQDFLEECHQLMWSATNVRSIFPLMKVVRFELGNEGLHFCVELCARALRMDPHLDPVTLSLIYKTIAFLLPNDLEVCRACALLVFFLERSVESYRTVYRLYMRPDQEYYADSGLIKNHMRFEILQILKKGLIFDPEFWNLVALRTSCLKLMSEKVMKDALNEIVEEDEWIPNDHVKEPYKLHVDSSNCYASRVVRPPVKERYKPVFKRIVVPPEVSGMPQVKRRGRKPGSRVIKVIEDFQPRRSYRQLEVAEEESIRRCGRRQRRRHARQVEKTTLRQRETRWLLGGDRGPVEEGDPKARNTAIPPVEALLSKRDGAGDDGDVEMAQEASQGQVDEGALIPLPALQETAGPHGEPVLLPFAPLHDVSLTPPINANLLEVSLPDNEVMDGFFTELRVEILPPVHISQEASIGEESIGVEKSPIADCVFEPCEKADPPIQYLDESSAMSSGVKAEMFVDSTNEVDNASIQRFHNYCKIPEGAANEDVPFSVDVPEQFSSVPKEMKPDSCQSWEEPSEEVSDGTLAEEETSLQRSAGFGPDLRESKGGDEHDTELADDICESPLEESVSDGTVGVPDDTKNVPDSPANVLHNQASDFYDATCDPDDATCVPGTTGVCSERTAVIGPTGVCGDRTAVIGPTGVCGDRTAVIGPTGVSGDRTAVIGPTGVSGDRTAVIGPTGVSGDRTAVIGPTGVSGDRTAVIGPTGVCGDRTAVIGPTGVCGDRTAVIGPTGVSGDRTAVIGPTGVCGDRTAVIGPTGVSGDRTAVIGPTGVSDDRTAVIGPTGVSGDRTAVIGPTGVSGDRTAVIGPTGVCGDRTAVIGPTACAVTDAVSDTASSPTGPEQEQAQSEATDSEQASTAPSPSPLPKAESSILTHRCRLCNKEFRGGNVLRHAIAHLQKDKLKCMFCRKLFNRGLVAKRHVVEHVEALKTSTAGEKRTTDSLGSLTQSLTLTEKHKRKSTSSAQERICTRRRKLTSVPEDLSGKASRPRKRKASAQNGIEEHRCPGEGCPRTFKNKGVAMLRHMKSHPGDVKVQEYSFQLRKGKCQFCSRQFDHLQHFQDHFRRHEHPLKHACFHHGCEDRFKTLAELRGHTKSHRPLQAWCAFEGCSQRFTQVSQLHHHEQRHYMPSGMVEEEPERIWVRPKPKDLLSAERGCRTQKEPANPMPCPAGSAGCGVKNTTEVKDQNVSAENGAGEMLVESESPDCVSCGISGKELINGHGKTENGTTVQPSQAEVKSAVDQEASVDNKGEDSRAKVENEAKHPDPAVQGHGKVEAEPSPYGGTSKKPFVRPPPSAYLDEKFISMPKRRKLSSVHLPSPVQLSGSQRQRCTRCFSSFSSADHLQSHLSSNKCTSLFGFDSDEEGAGEW